MRRNKRFSSLFVRQAESSASLKPYLPSLLVLQFSFDFINTSYLNFFSFCFQHNLYDKQFIECFVLPTKLKPMGSVSDLYAKGIVIIMRKKILIKKSIVKTSYCDTMRKYRLHTEKRIEVITMRWKMVIIVI